MQNNIAYVLGESLEISINKEGHKEYNNYFYLAVIGLTFEELNLYSGSNKEQKESIESMIH